MSTRTEDGTEDGTEAPETRRERAAKVPTPGGSGGEELPERFVVVARRFRAGDPRGLARAITLVENEVPGFERLLDELHEGVGRARRIGITGPPGAGKSTLTAALTRLFRARGLTVGIVAVDPTSPFTGGALLGDRVRMTDLATEEGIFIRSMASRGSLGGMATASREAADLMDAFGFDRILLETVGVGQSELEVAQACDTAVVVLVPESGDGIQAMKAGLMEVADLFVINKADRPGADRLAAEIAIMQRIRAGRTPGGGTGHHGAGSAAAGDGGDARAGEVETGRREAPVLQTAASKGEGIEALAGALDEHFGFLEDTGALELRRREHLVEHARSVLRRRFERRADRLWRERGSEMEEALGAGRLSPYAAADAVERAAADAVEPATDED
ncbi:MAG: methylmalonyl Co-A mutase-associated GTPase MeaB [Candidatus Palauibacterales bacterium]|nr:methylmalonyl Co-A mutase-associated GTPase MeaB [Candidatus Palauibacterales bacterium]MDP2529504.1 methylmalonyl Co-A mutase-associated GTPase MeaB [Candidatus Palauibacterales bacterium]MDP2585148.1 methylmalonyl Co-A mutase-associated GTPase MeaB [Candidatus Palauibacterales bacterium]